MDSDRVAKNIPHPPIFGREFGQKEAFQAGYEQGLDFYLQHTKVDESFRDLKNLLLEQVGVDEYDK